MTRCLIHYIDADLVADLDQQRIQTVVDAALGDDNLDGQQLNVMFVDDQRSSELHLAHFNDAKATDVMSFPDDSEDPETNLVHLGDLAVGVEVAKRVAAERNKHVHDELILYIVHGLLHLLGYDDIDESDRKEMWSLQQRYMKLIDVDIGACP